MRLKIGGQLDIKALKDRLGLETGCPALLYQAPTENAPTPLLWGFCAGGACGCEGRPGVVVVGGGVVSSGAGGDPWRHLGRYKL